MANGYMPRADSEAFNWMTTFAKEISNHPERYKITAPAIMQLNEAVNGFRNAYLKATDPQTRTTSAVNGKDTARKNAEEVIRPIYNQIKMDTTIGDDDKINAGVRPINSSRTRIAAPSTVPTLYLKEAGPGVHILSFSDQSSSYRIAKPAGAVGLQVMRLLSDRPIESEKELTYFQTFTRNKNRITYTWADDLKIATYAGRWITRKGEVGMWSKPVSLRVSAQFVGRISEAAA